MKRALLLAAALLLSFSAFAQDQPSPDPSARNAGKPAAKSAYPLLDRTFSAGLTPDQRRALGDHATLEQTAAALAPEQKADIRKRLEAARAGAVTPDALKELAHGYLLLDEHGPQSGQNVIVIGARLRELEPKKSDGYAIAAEGLYRQGDYPAAVEQARQAVALSGGSDKTALSILKMSEGRSSSVRTSAATAASDGVIDPRTGFTIPEKNDISPQAMSFVRQAVSARQKGDMETTWSSVQAAMNVDPASTQVQKLYAFAKEDRAKYADTMEYLRRSKEALAAGRGDEAVSWAQKAADRSGDAVVRGILELRKQQNAKLTQAPAKSEAPRSGVPLWPIGAGLGLTAAAYGIYRSKQTWSSEDGLGPSPELTPEQTRSKNLKTAAIAGTALIGIAAWEFGLGALAATRTLFAVAGPAAPTAQMAAVGGGVSGTVLLTPSIVAGGAKALGTTTVLVGGAVVASERYNLAQGGSPSPGAGNGNGGHPNGRYEASPKHGATARSGPHGEISAGPSNGQETLDNAVDVKPTSTQKVGVDCVNDEFVVFREHLPGRYHGYVSKWEELAVEARNALIKAGKATAKGRIIKP